jgi:EmrB/QacA subfamily drug resistance transporter
MMQTRSKWLVLGAAVFGLFMAILDASIVNIAIPPIQRDLDTDIDTVTWVMNSYNLVFAVLLIPAGRLADRFGRKRLFMLGIIVFSLSSLGAGLSGQIETLIAWRAVQAVGAAIMVPVSLAIVTLAFPPHQRGLALGVWGGMAGVAGAVGPTLGGILTEYAGWEWVFLVNVPVGAIAVPAILMIVPESTDPEARRRLDLPGIATLSVSLFALTLALIRGQEVGWSSAFITGLFATSVVFGVLFVLVEAVVSHPIIDLRMLRERAFSAANVTILMFGLGFFGALFLVVQYLTVVEGYSTLESAFALTPFPACILLTGPMAGRLTDKLGPRYVAIAGVLVFGAALLALSRLDGDVSYPHIAWRLALAGIGAGLSFAPLTTAAMGSVPGGRAGVGAGFFNTARQIGFTLGLAILVAVFVGALPSRLAEAQADAATVIEQSDLPGPAKEGIIQGILSAPVDEAGQAARSGRAQEFDLYDRVRETAGADIADSLRPTLDSLSQELQSIFAKATAGAFSRSFLVAAIILWVGLIPALLVPRAAAGPGPPPGRPVPATEQRLPARGGAPRLTP